LFLTLNRLCDRATTLGNHLRKYIHAIEGHRERVVSRLDETGNLGRVSFGDPAQNLRAEMSIVAGIARDANETKQFLAFYYALQYIIMEVHSLDILKYHLIQNGEQRASAFTRCFAYAQSRFRDLTSSYLETLCRILIPARFDGRYVILGVGTMGDRDDIDVAVLDDLEEPERRELSSCLARLAQVMIQTSSTLHFHMAEAMDTGYMSDSLEHYQRFVVREPYNPVIISQAIYATPLVGDEPLATQFTQRVAGRFYFHPGHSNQDHEGLLRALLGEMSESLQRRVPRGFINPKEDGLRPIKAYLAMSKSIHHIPSMDWNGILEFLQYRRSQFHQEYERLAEIFTFLETVRYLHQLLVVEEEEIHTRETDEGGALEVVAQRMGFAPRGIFRAQIPFLMAYYDQVDDLKMILDQLKVELVDQVRRVSSFSFFFDLSKLPGRGENNNLALQHVLKARHFFGSRFWDDLLDELDHPESPVPVRYLQDLARLSPKKRQAVLRGLVEWGLYDLISFMRFLISIRGRAIELDQEQFFTEMVDRFLSRWREESLSADRLASLYSLWPAEVYRFVSVLNDVQLDGLQIMLPGKIQRKELRDSGATLRRLVEVRRRASGYFLDHFRAAVDRHPQSLAHLGNPSELRIMAETLYGRSERFADLFSRREWLEAYYQLETVRLGLEFMNGRSYRMLLKDYRLGMHILLRSLYFLCRKELYNLYGMEWSKRHSIGIFLDAGLVAFHPFDPTLRVCILSFRDDEGTERFFREVVSSYQEELARLGFSLKSYPDCGAAFLEPRRLDNQLELLQSSLAARGHLCDHLEILRFNRIVGTRGHLQRFCCDVVDPLIEPRRSEIRGSLLERLDQVSKGPPAWPEGESLDLGAMPGGMADLERFFLFTSMLLGKTQEDELAIYSPDQARSAEMRELQQNTCLFQILSTAGRLLNGAPDAGISREFIHIHASVLKRHSEVSGGLLEDPAAYLTGIAERNVGLMKELLRVARP